MACIVKSPHNSKTVTTFHGQGAMAFEKKKKKNKESNFNFSSTGMTSQIIVQSIILSE